MRLITCPQCGNRVEWVETQKFICNYCGYPEVVYSRRCEGGVCQG